MNYEQTIDYLYSALPMFSRMGSAAFKKDLQNIRKFCQALGNPQEKYATIHVGGTNGKGSVSHMLAAALQEAGYSTGLYTSPHLYDFRERIKTNGQLCTREFVVDFIHQHKTLIEEIQPSFFEITVAMAFEYFKENKVDVAVIEVGLGGRLDSTNIIQPVLSVITNIGWDHMDMLGQTLPEIAAEKAGIIKTGVPIVVGERNEETDPVFISIARWKSAPLLFAEDTYQPVQTSWQDDGLKIKIYNSQQEQDKIYQTDLPGIYQKKNICTFLKAIDVLNAKTSFNITNLHTENALSRVKDITGLFGRWEIIHKEPDIVLEVAHNVNGITLLLEQLSQTRFKTLHMILGMVKDKDVSGILSMLPHSARFYFTQAQMPRALQAEKLLSLATEAGLTGQTFPDVNTALEQAMISAEKNDLIVVTGSIFLVAEVDRKRFKSD